MLDTGGRRITSSKVFRFEKWWLTQPDFKKLVEDVWSTESHAITSIGNWQFKAKLLRKKIKGWSINVEAGLKKRKKYLLVEIDNLDVSSESAQLSPEDLGKINLMKKELEDIWKIEEIALWQRSRDRKLVEGDRNNAYFQALANHRHRKNHLNQLKGEGGPVYSTAEMLNVATDFYKNLFSYEAKPDIHLDSDF